MPKGSDDQSSSLTIADSISVDYENSGKHQAYSDRLKN
jgi:hypothetical protein